MSYFKQIANRARPTNPGRSQNVPLLNPTRALFRPVALVQPSESADEHLGSDESWMTASPQTSTIASATQSISSPATVSSPSASSYLPSPTHLPAISPPIAAPQATTPPIGLSLPPREQSPPTSRFASPTKQAQIQDRANRHNPGSVERSLPTPLPVSPSPQATAASSNAPNLQRDSPQHLVPIIPTKYSGIDQQPSGKTPKPLVHQATVDSDSAASLTNIKAITQPLRTTLEPKHSTQILATERITEPLSRLTPPRSSPGTSSQSDASQRSSIHIGAIDIQITPPSVAPQPVITRPAATSTGSLSRGFTSGFGLRQG